MAIPFGALVAGALVAQPPLVEAPKPSERTLLDDLSSGSDLLASVPTIAFFDGSWSIVLHVGTLLVTRTWDSPQPEGIVADISTRVLYGTSWTTMLALEGMAVALASGGRFDWLAEAEYRTDWLFGVEVPADCPSPGAYGGCGIGIGGFGGISVRPVRSNLWYEVSGGWLEQRVKSDEHGTLAESAWVLAPMTVTVELDGRSGPLGLGLRAGPGLYFGMHNAHFHPATREGSYDVPWHELYPLDYGLGPGGRAEAHMTVLESFSLSAELVIAPLLLGSSLSRPDELPALDDQKGDLVTWRMLALGGSFYASDVPMRIGASLFAAELSSRPATTAGHQGALLRFDFPLRILGGAH